MTLRDGHSPLPDVAVGLPVRGGNGPTVPDAQGAYPVLDGYSATEITSPGPDPQTGGQRGHLLALDGLRGVAILLVLLFHFTVWLGSDFVAQGLASGNLIDRAYFRVALSGWAGVDLFFVLSGFLITGILLDAKGSTGYFRRFYIRRALRIFPLYYAYIAVMLWVLPALSSRTLPRVGLGETSSFWLWTYLTNVPIAWNKSMAVFPIAFPHFWSLAVEEQFYLIWPAVVLLLGRRGLVRVSIAMVVLALAIRTVAWVGFHNDHAAYVLLPARMDTLAVGALLAVAAYALFVVHPLITDVVVGRWKTVFGTPIFFGSHLPTALLYAAAAGVPSVAAAWISWHLFEKHFVALKDRFAYEPSQSRADHAGSRLEANAGFAK